MKRRNLSVIKGQKGKAKNNIFSLLPGFLFLLLPKCPLCIAFYASLVSVFPLTQEQYTWGRNGFAIVFMILLGVGLYKAVQQKNRPAIVLLGLILMLITVHLVYSLPYYLGLLAITGISVFSLLSSLRETRKKASTCTCDSSA